MMVQYHSSAGHTLASHTKSALFKLHWIAARLSLFLL